MESSQAGPKERGIVVDCLQHALRTGEHGLKAVPGLLRRVLEEGAWKDRIIKQTGERATFKTFAEFVNAPLLEGLGATIEIIEQLISNDRVLGDLFDQAVQGKHGGDRKSEGIKLYNVQVDAPSGNSVQATMRRLRKGRPDLLDKVKAGDISAHAAAIEAGWRKRMVQCEPTIEGFQKAIRKHLSEAQVDELKSQL